MVIINFANKKHHFLLTVILSLITFFGVIYEDAYSNRKVILATLMITYMLLVIVRNFIDNGQIRKLLILVNISVIILMEWNSKYAVNYFFQGLYYFEIIYCVINFKKQVAMIISGCLILASMIKFVALLNVEVNTSNFSLASFFLVISLLMWGIIFLAKTYWNENKKTNNLYAELLDAHRQLKDYAKEIEVMASYEERNRIARDLHDTLGHEMTGLIMQLEIMSSLINNGQTEEGFELLEDVKYSARENLAKVRNIVNTLNDESNTGTFDSIIILIENYKAKTRVNVKYEFNISKNISPDLGITLYRLIQEALTNSARHGNAKNIDIKLDEVEKEILLMIKDDGVGCDIIKIGNGLKGMVERVKLLDGTIDFESNIGFEILCKIPLEQGD